MPTTRSAKKRLRQNVKRRLRNRTVRTSVRSQVRRVREAIAQGDVAAAEEQFRVAAKRLDQAASKGVVHSNASSRLKSRLSAAIKKLKMAPAAS